MMSRKISIIAGVVILISLIGGILLWESKRAPQSPQNKILSDEELLNYAKSSFDKGKMMGKDFILGYHNEIPVRVSFPCSDVCPDYTIRIIRYDVSLGKCKSVGGEVKSIYVPFGIGAIAKAFCFPKVIVENSIYNFVPNVVVFTDKTEYKEGEKITLSVTNNLKEPIFLPGCNHYIIEKKDKGEWKESSPYIKRCAWEGFAFKIDVSKTEVFNLFALEPGFYRAKLSYSISCEEGKPLSKARCKSSNTVYSNEFTIKEKGAKEGDICDVGKGDWGNGIFRGDNPNLSAIKSKCEQKPECEWRPLGGKIISHYACCPKDLESIVTDENRHIYERCFILID